MYFSDDLEIQRNTSSRAFKVGIAVIGGSCLVLLSVMAVSASSPLPSTSAAEATSLFGLTASSRFAQSPVLPKTLGNQLPGPSPWKELGLACIEASNNRNRDFSMNANPVKAVMASMNSQDKALVARAQQRVIEKAEDLEAGILAPLGFWDPLGISTNADPGKLLFYREAELKHGRVAMLASLGFVVGENYHPLFGGDIDVPSYIAFQETPLQPFWVAIVIALGIPESLFYIPGFSEPIVGGVYQDKDTFSMKEDRIPGDLGWDPLGLKPKDPEELLAMENKEILNGRLAMIAIAGMVAEELVTKAKLFPVPPSPF